MQQHLQHFYNNNIIINFINNFNEKNSILTLQGIVNDDIINDLNDIYNFYIQIN